MVRRWTLVVGLALAMGCSGGGGAGGSKPDPTPAPDPTPTPPPPDPQAPQGLTYSETAPEWVKGVEIVPDTPHTTGGDAPTAFTVSPALPTGGGVPGEVAPGLCETTLHFEAQEGQRGAPLAPGTVLRLQAETRLDRWFIGQIYEYLTLP